MFDSGLRNRDSLAAKITGDNTDVSIGTSLNAGHLPVWQLVIAWVELAPSATGRRRLTFKRASDSGSEMPVFLFGRRAR